MEAGDDPDAGGLSAMKKGRPEAALFCVSFVRLILSRG